MLFTRYQSQVAMMTSKRSRTGREDTLDHSTDQHAAFYNVGGIYVKKS